MDELHHYFAQLASTLLSVDTVEESMAVIVHAAVEVIDGCEHASLSHKQGRVLESACSNDEIGPTLDRIQTETQQGPCLEAIEHGEVMVAADLAHDPNWPEYGPRAVAETGTRSSIASPLIPGSRVIGALNLFSSVPSAFEPGDDDELALISIFVAHAGPSLGAALERANLKAALRNRDLIGQAKGMLMARSGLDERQAFDVLSRASQRMNVKLTEVARQVVSGELTRSEDPRGG